MADINENDNAIIWDEFIQYYCKNGLGNMLKSDINSLVLFLLIKEGRYKLPEDMFKASRELKISESKIKSLYKDVQLKFMLYDEEEAKNKLITLIEKGLFVKNGTAISFIIREPLLRQYFEEWAASLGGFTEGPKGSELVKINEDVFIKILNNLSDVDFEKIKSKCINEYEDFKNVDDKKNLIEKIIQKMPNSLSDASAAMAIKGIAEFLKFLLIKQAV